MCLRPELNGHGPFEPQDFLTHFSFHCRLLRSWSGLCLHRRTNPVGGSVSSLYGLQLRIPTALPF